MSFTIGKDTFVEVWEILLELQNRFPGIWFTTNEATEHIRRKIGYPYSHMRYDSLAKAGYLERKYDEPLKRWYPKQYYYRVRSNRLREYLRAR